MTSAHPAGGSPTSCRSFVDPRDVRRHTRAFQPDLYRGSSALVVAFARETTGIPYPFAIEPKKPRSVCTENENETGK